MAEASEPVVRCGSCLTVLAEPPHTLPEQRLPCPECGSKARNFAVELSATVAMQPDMVQPGMAQPEAKQAETNLADAGYELQWLRLSEGGAWMVRVFDHQGKWIDGSVADDPEEALLAVAERLLPPGARD